MLKEGVVTIIILQHLQKIKIINVTKTTTGI